MHVAASHRLTNLLSTVALTVVLLGLSAAVGGLLFGPEGSWMALAASLLALFLEPAATHRLTLALYRARPLGRHEAQGLWALLEDLAARAGLPAVPRPYRVPSRMVNAFAVGNPRRAAIAFTDGLLATLSPRELAAVAAHEVAHIAHEDLRVLGLADFVSRLTAMFSMAGQLGLLMTLPLILSGAVQVRWAGLLLLIFSPQIASIVQLGLSRVREFDADRGAVELTGDPSALASALAKIEKVNRTWRASLLPGWGNPEPSWLRTHPATEERIRRLVQLAEAERSQAAALPHTPITLDHRPPRWHFGGHWF